MADNVVLIIIFNHRYDSNIKKLEELYQHRFSNIFFLVPFYEGEKQNVIPVYESSYYFHGYIAQGFNVFFKEKFKHYFFIADDLILNPEINEGNYQSFFNLKDSSSFISEVYSLHNINNNSLDCYPATIGDYIAKFRNKVVKKWSWCRVLEAYSYTPEINGVEAVKELPEYDEALALLNRHGVEVKTLKYIDVFGGPKKPKNVKDIYKNIHYFFKYEILRKSYSLKYPLAGSYSDIVIVSASSIKKFIHYCGVFAATKLFVELAIPTALLFCSEDVITEKDIDRKGSIFWPFNKKKEQAYKEEIDKYNYKLSDLMSDFPKDKLYIHPIKVSQWES